MSKVTPFLMLNDQLESAIEFYTSTFPDSRVTTVARAGKDGPINSAEFVIGGQSFMGDNAGGPYFTRRGGPCESVRLGAMSVAPGPRRPGPGLPRAVLPGTFAGRVAT